MTHLAVAGEVLVGGTEKVESDVYPEPRGATRIRW